MSFVTVVFALLLYAAAIVLVGGLAYKVWSYFSLPVPMKVFTGPAPVTRSGAVMRVAREVVFFESLFKSNKWIWIFGALFHASLLVVLLSHLRYFTQPVWGPIVLLQPIGELAGFGLIAGLGGLWARRLFEERTRYVTGLSDHLMLALLMGIGLSGLALRHVAHTDIVQLKAFALGLVYFDWQPLPADLFVVVHLLLVAALLIVLPFSKLLHIPGVFFSPAQNQMDDAREKRQIAEWNAAYDAKRER
ncbi:MAG: respiratory nitrate reductase subunit gamma [Rhodospirillales bacterium]|nr:respiratory nitrate reductase subunit gamma [Rhodospirillales bacterium]